MKNGAIITIFSLLITTEDHQETISEDDHYMQTDTQLPEKKPDSSS